MGFAPSIPTSLLKKAGLKTFLVYAAEWSLSTLLIIRRVLSFKLRAGGILRRDPDSPIQVRKAQMDPVLSGIGRLAGVSDPGYLGFQNVLPGGEGELKGIVVHHLNGQHAAVLRGVSAAPADRLGLGFFLGAFSGALSRRRDDAEDVGEELSSGRVWPQEENASNAVSRIAAVKIRCFIKYLPFVKGFVPPL